MLSLILIFFGTLLLIEWLQSKPKNYPPELYQGNSTSLEQSPLAFYEAALQEKNKSFRPFLFAVGPPCLPIVGSAPFVESKNFHLYLERVKRKYGPVVGFKLGPTFLIGVAGVKQVKEVLSRDEFQGRPKIGSVEPGIMFSEGSFWLAQRRFSVRHLRDFGFGKKTVEHVVLQEAEEFFENVLRKADVIQVSGLFSLSIVNVLWAMIAGERFSHDDDEFKYLLDCIQKSFRAGNPTGGISNAFPTLRKMLMRLGYFKEEKLATDLLNQFLQKTINSHKKTKTDEPRDFIDVYLTELEKTDLHPSFSEFTLKNVCVDLFAAGSESVGNSLSFCLLYCVLYPEWQEKLYEEIMNYDTAVPYLSGTERLATVEAFASEVTRCNTIASLTVPHKALRDAELDGYFIPKDSVLLVSLWSVLQDEELWKDPENFRPERFLENGKFRRDVGWMPAFGAGKRVCPGETLAKNMTLVYFIALIREFKFAVPEGHPKPSTICMPGFTNAPQPFYVKITRR